MAGPGHDPATCPQCIAINAADGLTAGEEWSPPINVRSNDGGETMYHAANPDNRFYREPQEKVMATPEPKREVVPLVQSAPTPMDMLQQAIDRGANIDIVSRLMDLQERWERNQARKEYDAAIAAAKAEIPPIPRNRQGHNAKKYADFAAIAKVVDPVISKHGLSYRFRTVQDDRIKVTCVVSHRAGHYEENTLAGPPDTSGNKNAIQSIGSTLTYLQRYSLVQALGLAADDDDDDGKGGGNGEKVSLLQVKSMTDKLSDKGIKNICKMEGIERLDDLPASRYIDVVTRIDLAIAAQKKKEAAK